MTGRLALRRGQATQTGIRDYQRGLSMALVRQPLPLLDDHLSHQRTLVHIIEKSSPSRYEALWESRTYRGQEVWHITADRATYNELG